MIRGHGGRTSREDGYAIHLNGRFAGRRGGHNVGGMGKTGWEVRVPLSR